MKAPPRSTSRCMIGSQPRCDRTARARRIPCTLELLASNNAPIAQPRRRPQSSRACVRLLAAVAFDPRARLAHCSSSAIESTARSAPRPSRSTGSPCHSLAASPALHPSARSSPLELGQARSRSSRPSITVGSHGSSARAWCRDLRADSAQHLSSGFAGWRAASGQRQQGGLNELLGFAALMSASA